MKDIDKRIEICRIQRDNLDAQIKRLTQQKNKKKDNKL